MLTWLGSGACVVVGAGVVVVDAGVVVLSAAVVVLSAAVEGTVVIVEEIGAVEVFETAVEEESPTTLSSAAAEVNTDVLVVLMAIGQNIICSKSSAQIKEDF